MPVAVKEIEEQRAARLAILADGNNRLNAFLGEFRAAVDPLLKKHGLELPLAEFLHHRSASGSAAYCVLHFYVFADPSAGDGK
jgi:hypothetical protein